MSWKRWNGLLLPVGAISLIFVMLVPLPGVLLDLLLAASIAASVLVFLTAVQVRRAVDFSVFPTLLLLLTLFRLSLNLASSRRILLHGHEGTGAAGSVIEAFGQFVVGGNYVVGFVLFLALIAIQFLVVSHGAVRTAEVTARFTLDALPGKQMAIDADMNAGLIDEQGARKRREAIAREAEFYGAMDGAARFNQRDAMATILITAINIIAGLLIGTLQQGVDLLTAVKTYTILTVGDGLVTMIPSLLISVAGGLVLTRASSAGALDDELSAQIFTRRKSLWITCAVLLALALVPGMPKIAFFLLAGAVAFIAKQLPEERDEQSATVPAVATGASANTAEDLAALLHLDELTLEIGFQLIPFVDAATGGQMLNRVRALRRHLATELGFVVPSVHITDNLRLRPREYVISLRGSEIGRWQTEGQCLLAVNAAMDGAERTRTLPGQETREPAFGVAAKWIEPSLQQQATALGCSVVDQTTVIGTHLGELIRRHAHELLSRGEVKRLLDGLSESHPKLVEELVPKLLSLGEVPKGLQQLLREQVSVRDLGGILEVLVEMAPHTKNTVQLVEAVRQQIGRGIVRPLLDQDGSLKVLALSRTLEEEIVNTFDPRAKSEDAQMVATPGEFLKRMADSLKRLTAGGTTSALPVLLCPSPARYHVRRWLEPMLPRVTVLSPMEIPVEVRVRSIGQVG